MKRKQMDSTEPTLPTVYTFSQLTTEKTLTLSGGGTIHSIQRGRGMECILYGSIDCEQDQRCLVAWEAQINETTTP